MSSTTLKSKLEETVLSLRKVFFHSHFYIDALLACFVSRASILLLGFRGSGKTHLMECLFKTLDPDIQAVQQGYLSAEIEDVFARPSLPQLIHSGAEEVVWKRITQAHIKGFDEIQRLGPAALSAMFKLLSSGKVQYLGQDCGVEPYWIIATANPWESASDTLSIQLPEPLVDRFDGLLWIPIPPYMHQLKINNTSEQTIDDIPNLWALEDLKELWRVCNEIQVSEEMNMFMTLINRILGFCQWAQDNDASSIEISRKRTLCSNCNSSYICSRIARSSSVRAKLSLERLAKGFCFLRGASEVEFSDVQKAFPLAYWSRLTLMNEEETSDRLKRLRELFSSLKIEILETKEAFKSLNFLLRKKFDAKHYSRLVDFKNSKIWFSEIFTILNEHYDKEAHVLRKRALYARRKKDGIMLTKISFLAHNVLPPTFAQEFYYDGKIDIQLSEKNLQKLKASCPHVYSEANASFKKGVERFFLHPPDSTRWVVEHVFSNLDTKTICT